MSKSARRQFLVSIEGINGYFATKTGGHPTSDVSKAWDGGSTVPENVTGPALPDNVVVSRPYDSARDGRQARALEQQVGVWTTNIHVQDTDRNLVAIDGASSTYTDAVLIRCSLPDPDASSGDVATWEMEFAVGAIA